MNYFPQPPFCAHPSRNKRILEVALLRMPRKVLDIPGLRYVKQTSVTFGVGTMDRIGALQRYCCKVKRTARSRSVDEERW